MMEQLLKTLVISNGNDGQVPFLIRLYRSLYNPHKGAFNGDFMFFSDHLSERSQTKLLKAKIPFTLLEIKTVQEWEKLLHSQKHALGKVAKPLFIRHAIETLGSSYSSLVYIDPDILVQKPLQEVLALSTNDRKGVYYSAQLNPTANIAWPTSQLERAYKNHHLTPEDLNDFTPEINTGFLFGDIPSISTFITGLIDFMVTPPFNQYANADPNAEVPNDWHDQDYFRVFSRIGDNDKKFQVIPEGYIYHLCNGVYEYFSLIPFTILLKHKESGKMPNLVHFAGGVWVHYFALSFFFLQVDGLYQWAERKLRRPIRLMKNHLKKTHHQARRLFIAAYRKIVGWGKGIINKLGNKWRF